MRRKTAVDPAKSLIDRSEVAIPLIVSRQA
jgi:hypothetical protein